MEQGPLGWLQLLDLTGIQCALALVLGARVSLRWLTERGSPWSAACADWSRRLARAGALLGLLALGAAVWLQAAVMADVPLDQAAPTVVTLLRDTHYGHVALAGFAAWVVVAMTAGSGKARWTLALAMLVTAWSRSAVSHAANSGDASMDVAVDVVHLLATSLWVGMVLVAARLPRPASAISDRLDAHRWVSALSSYATVALAVVVATGLYKLWRAVPAWALLPGSDYGRALFAKLALVGAAVLLGGYNRFRVLPGLHAALSQGAKTAEGVAWTRKLLAVLRIEMVVLVLVVGWAAVLASTEPPSQDHDAAMARPGDQVKFHAEQPHGTWTVTAIQALN